MEDCWEEFGQCFYKTQRLDYVIITFPENIDNFQEKWLHVVSVFVSLRHNGAALNLSVSTFGCSLFF